MILQIERWKMGDVAIITGDPCGNRSFHWNFCLSRYGSPLKESQEHPQNSDWIEIVTPTGAVASVAGKSGVVTLAIEDIGTGTGSLTDCFRVTN